MDKVLWLQLELCLNRSNLVRMPLLTDDENGVPLDPWDAKLFAYFCMRECEVVGILLVCYFFNNSGSWKIPTVVAERDIVLKKCSESTVLRRIRQSWSEEFGVQKMYPEVVHFPFLYLVPLPGRYLVRDQFLVPCTYRQVGYRRWSKDARAERQKVSSVFYQTTYSTYVFQLREQNKYCMHFFSGHFQLLSSERCCVEFRPLRSTVLVLWTCTRTTPLRNPRGFRARAEP
jgi:hypothetical protein